jgi:hypothetical protein
MANLAEPAGGPGASATDVAPQTVAAVEPSGEAGASLEVHHKPHPVHGWREFLKEYGIIVLGVLTALAVDQTAEAWRWREAVGKGREAIHLEMAFDEAYFRDRVTVAPCVDRRILAAAAALDAAAVGRPSPTSGRTLIGPGRLILTAEWNAEQASQTLTHFPRDELSKLGIWYDQLQGIRAWTDQEEDAWAKLETLDTKGPVGAMDVALLHEELQRARYLEYLMVLNARRELDLGRQLRVEPGAPRQDYITRVCGS